MKKLLLIIYCFSFLQGCGQKKEQSNINQNLHITADNIAEEIAKEVKHYPNEPMYAFRQYSFKCYFEIYINDILVEKNYNDLLADAFDINMVIYKSGNYKVKYKLYPLGKDNKYGADYSTFPDDTNFSLSLASYDKKNEQAADIEYLTHEVPKIEKKVTDYYSEYKFVGSGKTYYEGSFDINIDVPYNITPPFANAQDLRKMDRKELEKKVLKEYQKLRQIYLNKEKDNIVRLLYDNLRILSITNYSSKKEIQEMWEEVTEILFKNDIEILPIENYKLEFFADGRLVRFVSKNKDSDGNNYLFRYTVPPLMEGKRDGEGAFNYLFYLPKNKTELEVF